MHFTALAHRPYIFTFSAQTLSNEKISRLNGKEGKKEAEVTNES